MFPVTRIKGAELYKEGEPAKYLYFLKKGQVRLLKKIYFEKDQPLDNF